MDAEFPSNSHAAKKIEVEDPPSSADPAPKTKKIVNGKVIERKKPIGERLANVFINDGGGFAKHLRDDVINPMLKDMALSIVTQIGDGLKQGFEEMIFGPDNRGRRTRITSYGTSRPIVNYTRYSSPSSTRRAADRPPGPGSMRRSNSVKEIILESREDGELVLEELEAMIDDPDLGHCTLGDFYSLVDVTPRSTDEEWGWTDLSTARVRKLAPGEYLMVMPRPRPLDR